MVSGKTGTLVPRRAPVQHDEVAEPVDVAHDSGRSTPSLVIDWATADAEA